MTSFLITAFFSYLLGSIPFGYLLVKFSLGEDIRQRGSGNIGATNVSRISTILGIATLLLDACKGSAAVLIALLVFPAQSSLPAFAALFVVLGHLFPVWLKFRGGKGVATGMGAFLLLAPKSVLAVIAIFFLVVLFFRYVSLGSIVAVMFFPILVWIFHTTSASLVFAAVMAAVLILLKHRENLRRLASGTEPRFSLRHSEGGRP